MRARLCLAVTLCAVACGSAHAQTGPVIVVPGRPGVPVTIDGVIVDGAVVYGDWGLARPGHGRILIEGPVAFMASWDARGYFPATGRAPRSGRYEIEPPAPRRPRASTSFHRDWSIGSDPRIPVTEYPPFDPPPVVLAPRQRRR